VHIVDIGLLVLFIGDRKVAYRVGKISFLDIFLYHSWRKAVITNIKMI